VTDGGRSVVAEPNVFRAIWSHRTLIALVAAVFRARQADMTEGIGSLKG